MSKYSPGPWYLKTVHIETPIADVCFTGSNLWLEEEKANAKLIAAAPDLLSVLIEARERLAEMDIDEEPAGHALLYRINNEIKKATS